MVRKKKPDWIGQAAPDWLSFDKSASRREAWFAKSDALRHAASVIWHRFHPAFQTCFPDSGPPSGEEVKGIDWLDLGLMGTWRMLEGMALEAAVKGVIVDKNPSRVKGGKVVWKGIGNGGHDLNDLFAAAGVTLDDYESHVLEELTESVVWMEKYPVPKKRADMTMTKTNVGKWPAVIGTLFERLGDESPNIGEPTPVVS